MKILKEELYRIKSLMGVLNESLTNETMPDAPSPKQVKKIEDFPDETSGDVENGTGYKKVRRSGALTVYEGTFSNGVFKSGTIYLYNNIDLTKGYLGVCVVETSDISSIEENRIVFGENTTSFGYDDGKLMYVLKGKQTQNTLYSLAMTITDSEEMGNNPVEMWSYTEFSAYYKGDSLPTFETADNTLITKSGYKFIGKFQSESDMNYSLLKPLSYKVAFNDGKINENDLYSYVKSLESGKVSTENKPVENKPVENKPSVMDVVINEGDITILEKNDSPIMKGWIFSVKGYGESETDENITNIVFSNATSKLKKYFKEKLGTDTKINFITNKTESVSYKTEPNDEGKSVIKQENLFQFKIIDVVDYNESSFVCDGDCNNGQGTITYQNGNTLSGTFVNGKLNGIGKLKDVERGFTLNGNFINGILTGRGSIKFTDNKLYRGELSGDESLSKISITTVEGEKIDDVVAKHSKETYGKKEENENIPEFDFTGEVYYLNDLKTKKPLIGAQLVFTKYQNNALTENKISTYTDNEGKFSLKLSRGNYKLDVTSNNEYFASTSLDNIKLYNNINKNIILERTKKAKNLSDDFINIGVLTIFNNPVKFEKKIHNKSNNKLDYCKRFTNYYYRVVIEKGGELASLNNNNLINSKNFIINCYKEFVTDYDDKLKKRINTLTNLAGNIEVFEL